ncbi:MAG: hypothetical protein IKR52_08860 [Paludibacteraceae bacterium]|nr:hypothetical protein [Paludibacteraceae bacterium]
MGKFEKNITVIADDAMEAAQIASLMQNTVNVVDKRDIIKLLTKVKQNPSIVKTALKFI